MLGRQISALVAQEAFVFAASDSGVFRSQDEGATWTNVSPGLTDINVTSLTISNGYLFAATASGVWKRPMSELTSVGNYQPLGAIPTKFILSQNYPNPFNPSTEIRFTLPKRSEVSLTVFDLLGQTVKVIASGTLDAGEHRIRWDGTDQNAHSVASGIYFYRLLAGGFSQSRKMMLLK